MVADAAEHLERAATGKEVEQEQVSGGELCSSVLVPICHIFMKKYVNFFMTWFFTSKFPGQETSDPVSTLPTFPQNPFVEGNTHSSVKLKLQLFPIDDGTRRALELVGTYSIVIMIINVEQRL